MSPVELELLGHVEVAAALARTGQTEPLRELLDAGLPATSVDGKGDSLLMLAAYHGHSQTAAMLLERGADPQARNRRGLAVLDGVAFKGDVGLVELLLDHGVPVDDVGVDGRTALSWAAAFDRAEAVERLLARGADAERLDARGLSPRDHARAMGAQRSTTVLDWLARPNFSANVGRGGLA